MLAVGFAYTVEFSYAVEHSQKVGALHRLARGGVKVVARHFEVTCGGVLAAIEGSVERRLTSEEFSEVFERMADRLHHIDGLEDPGLWGQASNGKIEMEFYLADTGDTAAMDALAMAVISEVGAAGGVDIAECGQVDSHLLRAVAGEPRQVVDRVRQRPRFVLNGARHTAEAVGV